MANFSRFEVGFTVTTDSQFPYWPFDQATPNGIPAGAGISVDGEFIDPKGVEYRQPAFYYQRFLDEVRNGHDWHYPTEDFLWKVRFSPNRTGTWKYRIVAQDRQGTATTEWRSFTVGSSASHGFIRVSRADSRYFEFDDGTFFTGLGFELPEFFEDPTTRGGPAYRTLHENGINFVRMALGSLYGSAWTPWIGGRNRYAGYLPVAGLVPFHDEQTGQTTLTMRMDYEPGGDLGWFDACRLEGTNDPEAIKPNTRYQVRATYRGRNISGPRNGRSPFGFVVKIGGMFPNCYEPGTSRPVTGYGLSTSQWGQVEGVWDSGNRYFLPKVHLALENVSDGVAYVHSVSVREMLPGGKYGPEILLRPSMEYQLYIPQEKAYALDKIVGSAEQNGVYLKLVVMEKDDEIYQKIADDGEFTTGKDNERGVYGIGRSVNKTRWLQQAWWRYLQARWGYSPSIHSWELINEGDPASTRHFEAADEFGKFMHFRVFGVSPRAGFDHPNDHLVTTSFWHSFPAQAFWANPRYPSVDYADVHAYISTTFASDIEKQRMISDAAYYHIWHSQAAAAARIGKPVVRGEAGLDAPGQQDEGVLGVQRDTEGVWLHNFLWAGLHSGALYELYWWRSHIWNKETDHRAEYRLVGQFLAGLELNKGGFQDWNGTVSTSALRVVGQKNIKAGTMHLWVQNVSHTWKNVRDGRAVVPTSGTIVVPGFRARTGYALEWWDTYATEKSILRRERIESDGSGRVTITVNNLQTDVAVTLSMDSGPTVTRNE